MLGVEIIAGLQIKFMVDSGENCFDDDDFAALSVDIDFDAELMMRVDCYRM